MSVPEQRPERNHISRKEKTLKKNKTTLMLSAALVAGALVLAGCSAPAPAPGGNASASQQSAGNEHNGADAMFAQMMIPHHEQAVLMSETMLEKKNLGTETVKLATDIKNAQAPGDQAHGILVGRMGRTPGDGPHHGDGRHAR